MDVTGGEVSSTFPERVVRLSGKSAVGPREMKSRCRSASRRRDEMTRIKRFEKVLRTAAVAPVVILRRWQEGRAEFGQPGRDGHGRLERPPTEEFSDQAHLEDVPSPAPAGYSGHYSEKGRGFSSLLPCPTEDCSYEFGRDAYVRPRCRRYRCGRASSRLRDFSVRNALRNV